MENARRIHAALIYQPTYWFTVTGNPEPPRAWHDNTSKSTVWHLGTPASPGPGWVPPPLERARRPPQPVLRRAHFTPLSEPHIVGSLHPGHSCAVPFEGHMLQILFSFRQIIISSTSCICPALTVCIVLSSLALIRWFHWRPTDIHSLV